MNRVPASAPPKKTTGRTKKRVLTGCVSSLTKEACYCFIIPLFVSHFNLTTATNGCIINLVLRQNYRIIYKGSDILSNKPLNEEFDVWYLKGEHELIASAVPSTYSLQGRPLWLWLEVAWAHHLAKTKRYNLIIEITDHVLNENENDGEISSALKLQPLAKQNKGEVENALWINGRALEIYPNDGEQWNTQANLYIRLKNFVAAYSSASKAIALAQASFKREVSKKYLRHLGHGYRAMAIAVKELTNSEAGGIILDLAQNSYTDSQEEGWSAATHIEGLDKLRVAWGLKAKQ